MNLGVGVRIIWTPNDDDVWHYEIRGVVDGRYVVRHKVKNIIIYDVLDESFLTRHEKYIEIVTSQKANQLAISDPSDLGDENSLPSIPSMVLPEAKPVALEHGQLGVHGRRWDAGAELWIDGKDWQDNEPIG